MSFGQYILIGKEPVLEPDLLSWGSWFQYADRHVAKTQVGPLWVSTVFLGLDHNHAARGPPVLFETMIRGAGISISNGREFETFFEDYQERYCTWEEAEAGHARAIKWAEACVAAATQKIPENENTRDEK